MANWKFSQMNNLAPVALFVYNRPEHTISTIESLKKNELAYLTDLFIFSDGSANQKETNNVKLVREIISKVDGFKSVVLIEREKNLGLANSIIDGVTFLISKYRKLIVFEDDILSSINSLKYFNDALSRYEFDEKVMHVSGYMYPIKSNNLPETFFFRAPSSWGWATWDRAWKNFNPEIDEVLKKFNSEMIYQFSIDGSMNFWKQMIEFQTGKNNSWAIRWYASMFLKNGLSINPSKSLIKNIGNDGSGVHSGKSTIFDVDLEEININYFPNVIEENKIAYNLLQQYFKNRKGNIIQRLIRYIEQVFN